MFYVLINSSSNAALWFIPILITVLSASKNLVTPYIDWPKLIISVLSVFIVFGLGKSTIDQKIGILKASLEETIDLLKEHRNRQVQNAASRPPRTHPDEGQVSLKEIDKAIEGIRKHGYLDFKCDVYFGKIDRDNPMMLFLVAPGMSKLLLVGRQLNDGEASDIFVLLSPTDTDSRDFAETWFNHIFKILAILPQAFQS